MIYLDTSTLVKLYIQEVNSAEVAEKIRKYEEPIPLCSLHELEFINALNLRKFRQGISQEELQQVMSQFSTDEIAGVYYRPSVYWPEVFQKAIELSTMSTSQIGSRSLDILHVAIALCIKADKFFSFDERQLRLADLTGLEIVTV